MQIFLIYKYRTYLPKKNLRPPLKRNVGSKSKKTLGPNNRSLLGAQVQNRLSQVEKRRKTHRKKTLSKREENASVGKGHWNLNRRSHNDALNGKSRRPVEAENSN